MLRCLSLGFGERSGEPLGFVPFPCCPFTRAALCHQPELRSKASVSQTRHLLPISYSYDGSLIYGTSWRASRERIQHSEKSGIG
jgi:hypothetical protein